MKEDFMFRSLVVVCLTSLFIFGCKGRDKTSTDTANALGSGGDMSAPVESTPMNFSAEGSDSGKIAGLSTVYFDFDKSTLSQSARDVLKANAEWMKNNTGVKIQIEGHCDNRGSIEYNLALGERRANAVRSYLTSIGVAGNRMTVLSYGEEKPLVSGDSEESWAKNRRANFVPVQ
jgi:peptidoglycan-associated lipoprotein